MNNLSKTSNSLYTGSDEQDNKYDNSSLDNRSQTNTNRITINSAKQRVGLTLTLVDMHPLMISPIKSDDDLLPVTFDSDYNNYHQENYIQSGINAEIGTETETETEWRIQTSSGNNIDNTLHLLDAKQHLNDNNKSYMSSGESEPDVSQYQASVEPTFQSVSLTNHNPNKSNSTPNKSTSIQRELSTTPELITKPEDDSSVETISNNSSDEEDSDINDDDYENEGKFSFKGMRSNKQQQQQSSIDKMTNLSNVNVTFVNDANNASVKQSSAIVVTLSDGQTRDIDMKVIEPYKRCLSHGGYIKTPGNNAIVIFSACYLPDRSRTDYHYVMENLFL